MLINVSVCTYRREKLLFACLQSLSAITVPRGTVVKISVVDNDSEMSARQVVAEIQNSTGCEITYAVEEKRGIPCARNRAIDIANSMGADLLVFIDDDEIAEPDWLEALFRVSGDYDHQAVIHGAVLSELDPSVPKSISGLFSTRVRSERQALTACATDNVMIPLAFVNRERLRFDESKPLAGGTDTIFFTQAHKLGLNIYQTNTAKVTETIPLSRTRLSWLSKRKFRAGVTDAWRKISKGRSKGGVMMSAFFQVAWFSVQAAVYCIAFMPLRRNESYLRAAKSMGVFMGCLGVKVDSYQKVDS
ncbi:glycosyl transferase family A [Marinobacterium nitratireducens]|uniref:Glycosyl transferase family A n=1 Tax=Marinobacterium nitratireducens TaxID=518897 RepID=A0A918DQX4_9GAMM|nr:glycosyltransferase family A protein [Marinobacterium nitratireducens]GGO78006.1 glycosyl transferase family A [Marinobacterium nitratireducens]